MPRVYMPDPIRAEHLRYVFFFFFFSCFCTRLRCYDTICRLHYIAVTRVYAPARRQHRAAALRRLWRERQLLCLMLRATVVHFAMPAHHDYARWRHVMRAMLVMARRYAPC